MKFDIFFEKEGFEDILAKIKEKTEKINTIYKEIEEKSKEINGDNETWKGKGQASFYKSYLSISKKFEDIETGFQDCNNFLEQTVIKSYCEKETSINKKIDDNKDNLNIN